MSQTTDDLIICEDGDFPGPGKRRVVLNLTQQTATFENCHWPRAFFSTGYEAARICRFDELLAAHDFLTGASRDKVVRAVLSAGQVINVPVEASQLGSVFISTAYGRCRVFADWRGFGEFRQALQHICGEARGGHWSDDPRWIPLYAVIMLAIVAGLVWWLL